jgi:hypothetical protein
MVSLSEQPRINNWSTVDRAVQVLATSQEIAMATFDNIVLSTMRGGGFEAELLNNTGYAEQPLRGEPDYPARPPGVTVVWIDADRSPDTDVRPARLLTYPAGRLSE